MKNLVLGTAVLMVFLCAAVIPVSAAVTKTTCVETASVYTEMQIGPEPDQIDLCHNEFTFDTMTWWKDLVFWKQDTKLTISGICDGGTTFECHSINVDNAQNNAGDVRTSTATGNCWFSYLDGTKPKNTFHSTFANGEPKVDFSKWN